MPVLVKSEDKGFLIPNGPYVVRIAEIKLGRFSPTNPDSDPCYTITYVIEEATVENQEWVGKQVRFMNLGFLQGKNFQLQRLVEAIEGSNALPNEEILLDGEPFDTDAYDLLLERKVGVNFQQRPYGKEGKVYNDYNRKEPFFPVYLWDEYRETD